MDNYSFIKEFQNIKLVNICKRNNINMSNLLSGCTTEENYKKVKGEILKELLMLFIADKKDELIIMYLYNEILERLENENRMLREIV